MDSEESSKRLQNAAVAIETGKLEKADGLLESLRRESSDNPDVWQLSGALWMRWERPGDAEPAFRRATELAPGFAPGWVSLFRAREALGNLDGAASALREAVANAPEDPNLRHALADFLYRHSRFEEALDAARELERRSGGEAGVLSMKAAILERLERLPEAEEAVRQALTRESVAPLHLQLARILESQRVLGDALRHYDLALEQAPDDVDVLIGRANCLAALGRYDGAIQSLRRVLEIKPSELRGHYLLGSYLESNHQLAEARQVLERGLALAPDHPRLRFALARCSTRLGDTSALAQLDELAASDLPRTLQISFYAERGALHDRLGNPKAAFADFDHGKRVAAEIWTGRNPGPNPVLGRLEKVHAWLTSQEQAPWPVAPPRRPAGLAFLIGFPRTGTTLLGRLLDAHPDCEVLDEYPSVGHLAHILAAQQREYPEALPDLDEATRSRLAATYHEHMARFRTRQSPLLIDKLPMNTQYLPLIRRLFPQAPIIHATRHPLAACLSCFMQPFELNPAMANFFTLPGCATLYRLVAGIRREDLRLWGGEGVREVRYEDLVADFEPQARALLDFLGLAWTNKVLDFSARAREAGNVRTPSYRQVSEGVYTDAVERWRRYESYLEPIARELEAEIKRYEELI